MKLQSINPATGALLGEYEPASPGEVRAAVARASEASTEWRRLSVGERTRYLWSLKEVLFERREEIAALITREAGKPVIESLTAEVLVVLDMLEYFARHAQANDSDFDLSASAWTRDARRGEGLARRLEAGAVMVNDCISYFGICEAPHGGVKASGIGPSHSQLGLLEMVRVKYIDVDLVPGLPNLWWFG